MPLGTRFSQQRGQFHNSVVVDEKKLLEQQARCVVFAPGACKRFDFI